MATTVILALMLVAQISYTDAACTMPDLFRNSQWVDNAKGNVSFTTWKMDGWGFTVGADTISEWEVVDNTKFAEDEGFYLALRSTATFEDNGTTYYSYLCMKFERVSTNIYKYYTLHDENPLAGNNNVLTADHDDLTRFGEICDVNYNIDKKLFNVFVKSGIIPSMTCPNPILANFKYEVTLPSGDVVCQHGETGWRGCDDKQQVKITNTSCSYPVAYSDSGNLNCIAHYKDGAQTSIMLMNTDDTVDDDKTFRFACVISKDDGSQMVITPRECFPGQTFASFPKNRGGDDVGQRVQSSDVDTDCRIRPDDGDDDGLALSVPAIVGIVIGAIALIVIIIAIVCCCCKMRD